MTDKKYTLTEETRLLFLVCLSLIKSKMDDDGSEEYKALSKGLDALKSLTPDPSPSGDVVERIRETVLQALCDHEDLRKLSDDYEDEDDFVTKRIAPIIEAEVQRRLWGF